MRRLVLLAVVLGACSDGDRYVGQGIAEVTPRLTPRDKRTSRADDEEARVRRLDGGRFEVTLDECSFQTEPAVAGRAAIAPGTPCRAKRRSSKAQIVVQSGEVELDEAGGTLSLRLEGEGSASSLGSEVDVLYRYTFRGERR